MNKQKEPPTKIWLQYYGDSEEDDDEVDMDEVTWCRDWVYPRDVAYVRMDTVQRYLPKEWWQNHDC